MAFRKTSLERLRDRQESIKQLRDRATKHVKSAITKKVAHGTAKSASGLKAEPSLELAAHTKADSAPPVFVVPRLATIDGAMALHLTPWATKLATLLLQRAQDQKISIRLVWPTEVDTTVTLHAVASLSRVLGSELNGLRAVFYPGTNMTWVALDRITIDRRQLDELCVEFYNGRKPLISSSAFRAILDACHEARYAETPPPVKIRQLVQVFRYDPQIAAWAGVRKAAPFDSLIAKIPLPSLRRELRERIAPDWQSPPRAPGALLVLHRHLTRKEIRAALSSKGSGRGDSIPIDAILIDASTRSILADQGAVRAVPKVLSTIFEARRRSVGTLIVTNDPGEYGFLLKALERAELSVDKGVLPAESSGTEWLASGTSRPITWTPDVRTMINFKVRAIDEPAAQLAKKIRRIIDSIREEGPQVEEPFLVAQHLVLRTALVPGGLSDVLSGEAEDRNSLAYQLNFERIRGLVETVLAGGGASSQRKQIDEVMVRIRSHLDACSDATPLALALQEQIERYVLLRKEEMTIVFFAPRDISVAHKFLARKLGEKWNAVLQRTQWLSLIEALTSLKARSEEQRLVIVGLNPRMLRFLVMQKEVPTHTSILIPSHQAVRMLPQIRFLNGQEVLKPYRVRLYELQRRLEECLKNIPDVEVLARAYDTRLPTRVQEGQGQGSASSDPAAYHLTLNDGRHISATGFIFRYDGLEDERFRRVPVREIDIGDSIFWMSDELRDEIEAVLSMQGVKVQVSAFHHGLEAYRAVMRQALESTLAGMTIGERISALQKKMAELSSSCGRISYQKLRYWMSLPALDSTPRGPRDPEEYFTFCRALSVPDSMAKAFWRIICKVRSDNQVSGRQLAALYTEMLLAPESAKLYRGIQPEAIRMLQDKALDCVAEVIGIEPPTTCKGV